jgi:hypothetical protein
MATYGNLVAPPVNYTAKRFLIEMDRGFWPPPAVPGQGKGENRVEPRWDRLAVLRAWEKNLPLLRRQIAQNLEAMPEQDSPGRVWAGMGPWASNDIVEERGPEQLGRRDGDEA